MGQVAATAGAWGVSGANAAADVPSHSADSAKPVTDPVRFAPKPGQVAAIAGPGTDAPNTLSAVMYGSAAGPGSRAGHDYFSNWCSGVYARHDGPLGAMVFCNGGDADYWGNEVYRFDLATRTWTRLSERSTGLNGKTAAPDDDPNFDAVWGEHISPGGRPPPQPGVPHSYDQMEYLPPQLGGGPRGAFMFASRTIVYRFRRYRHPHVFDLERRAWRRGAAAPGISAGIGSVDAPSWSFDSRRNQFWGIDGGASGIFVSRLNTLTFDPASGLATAQSVPIPRFLTPWGCPVSRYWPRGDCLLLAGVANERKAFGLWACPLAEAGARGFSALPLAGDAMPPPGDGYGLAYCDELDCFFVRTSAAQRQKIWKVTPPKGSYLANPWAVEEIVMPGATIAAHDNGQGMWKRLMYAPPLKCLLWVDHTNGPVYAYRPAGT